MKQKVKTIYLEMKEQGLFRPSSGYESLLSIKEISNDAYLNFVLFAAVGLPWRWYSRLSWSIEEWNAYFHQHHIRTFLGFRQSDLVGYFELEFTESKHTELKFFGLMPQYIGRGLGGALLSHAVEEGWKHDTTRLWLHTCDLDSEAALNNYISRGFKVYKEESAWEEIPEKEELLALVSGFYNQYIENYAADTVGE
jgi:ribosomal protein S18 acetylase RimI-like enzyme